MYNMLKIPEYSNYSIDMNYMAVEGGKLSGLGLKTSSPTGWCIPQGIRYYNDISHTKFDYGTIRLWWSPILAGGQLREATSDVQYSGLINYLDSAATVGESNYISVFDNHTAQKFT